MTGTPQERRDSIYAICDDLAVNCDVAEDILAPIRAWADGLVRPRGEESDTASAACAAPSSPDGAPPEPEATAGDDRSAVVVDELLPDFSEPCDFGCGPDTDARYVRPGYSIVLACPIHGRAAECACDYDRDEEGEWTGDMLRDRCPVHGPAGSLGAPGKDTT